MSRQHGTFEFSNNLEPKIMAPLDARTLVYDLNSLLNTDTWLDSSGNMWIYNGLPVTVVDPSITLSGIYILLDKTKYDDIKSWLKVGAIEPMIFKNTDGKGPIFRDISNNIVTLRSIVDTSTMKVTFNDDNIFIDASLPNYALNSSLMYEVSILNDYNIKQDISIASVNSSINDLYSIKLNNASIGQGFIFNTSTNKYDIFSYDNSIALINSSINSINSSINAINASLNIHNSSINDLYSIKLNNASIGQGFIFNQLTRKFDIFSYDTSISLINASINRIDSSISTLFNIKLNDASIGQGFIFNISTNKYDVISTDPSFAAVNASINEIKTIMGMSYPSTQKVFIDASTTALNNISTLDYMLSLMAPAKPLNMNQLSALRDPMAVYAARMSAGLSSDWYGTDMAPGSLTDSYSFINTYRVVSSSYGIVPNSGFYAGMWSDNSDSARGIATVNINSSEYGITLSSTGQNIAINNRDVSAFFRFTREQGFGGSNNNFWRVAEVDLFISSQRPGRVLTSFRHSFSSGYTNATSIVYDPSPGQIVFNPSTSISKVSGNYTYLSGIPHHALNTTFNISYTINSGIYNPVYDPNNVSIISSSYGSNVIVNPDTIPNYNDSLVVTNKSYIFNTPNVTSGSANPIITLTGYKPGLSNVNKPITLGIRANTYPSRSNGTTKYFTDEATRILYASPEGTDGVWDSTNVDIFKNNEGHAQIQNGILCYPSNLDYGITFSGPKYYRTRFTKTAASSGRLTFTGFNPQTFVNPYPNSDVNIILCLTDQGIYFDLSKPYSTSDPNDGKTIDKAKGARVGSFGTSYIDFTFGTFSTGLETAHKDTFCMLFIINNLFASTLSQITLS